MGILVPFSDKEKLKVELAILDAKFEPLMRIGAIISGGSLLVLIAVFFA